MTDLQELESCADRLTLLESKRERIQAEITKTRGRLARAIARERKHRKITLSQVAVASDTCTTSVDSAETISGRISINTAVRIARALLWIIRNELSTK